MAYCIKHRRFTARWHAVSIDGEHHADDFVVLAKSKRAAQRLLKNSCKLLEGKLKLKLNADKSRVVTIFSHKQFKFLGFCLGKNGKGIYIRGHRKSLDKVQAKAADKTQSGQKCLCSDGKCKMVHPWMDSVFLCSDMNHTLHSWNEWLRCRFRTYIWKQWKKPKTRAENMMKLGFRNGGLVKSHTLVKAIGGLHITRLFKCPLQTKDSHRRDILISRICTSPCT